MNDWELLRDTVLERSERSEDKLELIMYTPKRGYHIMVRTNGIFHKLSWASHSPTDTQVCLTIDKSTHWFDFDAHIKYRIYKQIVKN